MFLSRRRRDTGLIRTPRDEHKPQYVIPADGVYLVVVRVWAKPSNKAPFTATVHVGMHSPDSAVSGISIHNVKLSVCRLSKFRLSFHFTPLYPSNRNSFEILLNELS